MPHRAQFALADLHTWGTVLDYNSRIQDEGYAWPGITFPMGWWVPKQMTLRHSSAHRKNK